MIIPRWTKKYSNVERGRDFLAIEYAGVIMLEKLLPGISNITKRARYYSFFPWVIYQFFKDKKIAKTYKNFKRHRTIQSLAFLFANGLHYNNNATGIDGIDYFRKEEIKNKTKSYIWSSGHIKNFKDNYWIYSQKLKQMGITSNNEDYEIESLTKTKGKLLAEAFEGSIKNTKYFKRYCNSDNVEIPVAVLEEYGKAAGVLELKDCPKECDLLIESFFRFEDIQDESGDPFKYYTSENSLGYHRARRESLLLYLDIIDKSHKKLQYDDLRTIQYYSKVQGNLYRPPKKLRHILEFWRMFQGRQYFVYALESIFMGMTMAIENRSISLDDFVEESMQGIDFKQIKKAFNIDFNRKTFLRDIFSRVENGERDEDFDRSLDLNSKLTEEKLLDEIANNSKFLNYTYIMAYPLLLIMILYLRLNYYRKTNSPYWNFGKIGKDINLSMDIFFSEIEKIKDNNGTLEDFFRLIIEEHVIKRHIYVAILKLSWYKNDTFHFSFDNGKLRGIRIPRANMNAAKFDNVLNILSDLDLIQEKNGVYKLTSGGKQLLNKYEK